MNTLLKPIFSLGYQEMTALANSYSFWQIFDTSFGLNSNTRKVFSSENLGEKPFLTTINQSQKFLVAKVLADNLPSRLIQDFFSPTKDKTVIKQNREDDHEMVFNFVTGLYGGGSFNQGAKWDNPTNITYNIGSFTLTGITKTQIDTAIREAFNLWRSFAPLTFTQVTGTANITIGASADPAWGFGTRNGTIARVSYPGGSSLNNVLLRYDTAETWSIGTISSAWDFLETTVHEIGHALGLNHPDQNHPGYTAKTVSAVMNSNIDSPNSPTYTGTGRAFLTEDDQNGIQTIYGSEFKNLTTDISIGGFNTASRYLTLDANNDGRTDVIEIWNNGNAAATTWKNNGNGQFDMLAIDTSIGGFNTASRYLTLDANNDGRTDVIEIWNNGNAAATTWKNNGNGQFDMLAIDTSIGGLFNTASRYLTLDANNDGRTDVIEIWNNGNAAATTWKNNGNGQFDMLAIDTVIGGFGSGRQYLTLDVNTDGRTDIVEIFNNQNSGNAAATTWKNNGNGQFDVLNIDTSFGGFNTASSYLTLDANTDGRADIIEIWNNGGKAAATTWLNNGVGDFRLAGIDKSFGGFSTDRRYLGLNVINDGRPEILEIFNNPNSGMAAATTWWE